MPLEMREALRAASGELVANLTQELPDKLQPPIPPHGSAVTIRASPHQVQANHLVAGLTYTLGGVGPSYADPCTSAKKPLLAKNGTTALQPCGEFHTC